MDRKIRMLVIPSDRTGVGYMRSLKPHTYIQEHYPDEFDIDIVYNLPRENLDTYLKQYDLIHIHKQLDRNCEIMKMINFLGIPVIVDIDDHYNLGNDHPMSITAKRERWHEPIINHLKLANYVTTTTPIFADEIKKHNKNVFVFPNAIDPNEKQYEYKKNPDNGKLRVGIICGSSHLHDIELLGDLVSTTADNVQIVLCGFDTNGTITMYNQQTGEKTTRPIEPKESVWYTYEKIITGNYKTLSDEHKAFLSKFIKGADDPFVNEKYRRMWTRNINEYATHYQNVDVLLAPLKENEFNKMKCITGESLVSTKNGIFRISDLVDNKIDTCVDDGNKIVNYFKYENEKTLRLITYDGYEIEGTPTHRIMINGEWKQLSELKVGDKIELAKPEFAQKEYQELSYPMLLTKNTENKLSVDDESMFPKIKITENWGRLFGYLLGDGNFTRHGFGISCDSRYEDVVEDVDNLISLAGLHAVHTNKKVDKRCKNNLSKYGFGVDLKVTSNTFSKLCKRYGLYGENGKNFHIPYFILKSPKTVIREFLRGLFEADGTVGENSNVSFTTKSLELAQEVQYLLLGFGITSRINRSYNSYYRKYYYNVNLRKKECCIFEKEIGFVSSIKNKKLSEYISKNISNHHNEITFTSEIISIEESINDVYDIEVENSHLFNANGIINHNSQLKLIEAGFSHTAIIMQDFGAYTIDSIPMIEFGGKINPDGNCLLVDSRKNHKDWVKYINKLAANPDMVKKLQENLYNYVKDKYSIAAVCKERADFYKKIVNGEI